MVYTTDWRKSLRTLFVEITEFFGAESSIDFTRLHELPEKPQFLSVITESSADWPGLAEQTQAYAAFGVTRAVDE